MVRDSCSVWLSALSALSIPFILALVAAVFLIGGPAWIKVILLLLGVIGVGWGLCFHARERMG